MVAIGIGVYAYSQFSYEGYVRAARQVRWLAVSNGSEASTGCGDFSWQTRDGFVTETYKAQPDSKENG